MEEMTTIKEVSVLEMSEILSQNYMDNEDVPYEILLISDILKEISEETVGYINCVIDSNFLIRNYIENFHKYHEYMKVYEPKHQIIYNQLKELEFPIVDMGGFIQHYEVEGEITEEYVVEVRLYDNGMENFLILYCHEYSVCFKKQTKNLPYYPFGMTDYLKH